MNDILIASVIVLIALNVYASVRLYRNGGFNRTQMVVLSVLVWVLPFLGAMLLLVFVDDDETPKGPHNPNDGQGTDSTPGISSG